MIVDLLEKVARGEDLTRQELAGAVDRMIAAECPEAQFAALLMGLRMKGESVDELVGAASALRARAIRLPLAERPQLDTAGTGGDGSGSLNLSTAAALIAASAGVTVAKHGNRSISSRCGSADVLEELGVPVDADPVKVANAIETEHFGFLFAPHFHPATKAVAALRRSLRMRTLFNLLGPLTNPANVRSQMVGIYHPSKADMMALALRELGVERALVVSAAAGLDEISPEGETQVVELRDGGLRHYVVTAESFGLRPAPLDSIRGGDPATNAQAVRDVFAGRDHPAVTAVLMNASAALVAAGAAEDFPGGTELARRMITNGTAAAKLNALATLRREAA